MVERSSLEGIVASFRAAPWTGRVYRLMLGDTPPDRENTLGARWNPPDIASIYASLNGATCIAEVEYNLARQPRPVRSGLRKTLYEIEVSLAATVDIEVVLPKLERIGVGRPQLFADDMKASQEFGRLVTWFGFDGLFVPSARGDGNNLVIYPGRAVDSYRFEVIHQRAL